MMNVVLAGHWVDPEGVTHSGNDVVEVDNNVGRRLIYNGQARPAPVVPQEEVSTTEAEPTERAEEESTK